MYSCDGKNTNIVSAFTTASPVKINRFDQALFALIDQPDSAGFVALNEAFGPMTSLTGKAILNMQSVDQPGFYNKLIQYYSEPTLKQLYRDAITQYADLSQTEQQLGNAVAWLQASFPNLVIPEVYLHVSGLNQNVLVADNLISLSIDKYLGENYPLYTDFFYDAQRRKMTPDHIVPDYIAGLIMSEYPFEIGRAHV